ncbi:hypothetical protein D187_010049 [Cystobacter fuscus DSM 2262]|uniref:Uncharacterized protein n=1 Tax=Cystobacter fuscus (strain ATCC 25194 / DSM 2262 / NBRC 100088 / M29) TaxID=1242864 RepID=S9PCQ1_CYSF2|nr:hypothetical protein D187_010049 [Cystobacter fuscus DSM 2262]
MSLRSPLVQFVVVALVFPLVGAEPPRGDLEEALRQATVVVLGQVESMDFRGERQFLTLQVEHVARGELPDVITFDAEPPKGQRSSIGLGERMIAFLEPTSQVQPRFRLALGGAAALKVIRDKAHATFSVEEGTWFHLCDASPPGEHRVCKVPLKRFLSDAGLRPFTPSREATFCVIPRPQCEPCDLEEQLRKSGAADLKDCGTAPEQDTVPPILQCVRESLKARTPFLVRMPRQGVDSYLVDAFVSDGTHFRKMSFDSSTTGGPRCSALVFQRRCESLVLRESDAPWLQCETPGRYEELCAQSRRVYALGPAEKVSRLSCDPEGRRGMWLCDVLPAGARSGKHTPRPEGPDFICSTRSERLFCREE